MAVFFVYMMNRECSVWVASPGTAEESDKMTFKDNCDFAVCIVEAAEGSRKNGGVAVSFSSSRLWRG